MMLLEKSLRITFIWMILSFQLISLSVASADDRSTFETHTCGKFKIIPDLAEGDAWVCQETRGRLSSGFKTQGSTLQLHVSKVVVETSRNSSEVVDRLLLDLIQAQVDERFRKTFAWIDDVGSPAEAVALKKEFMELREKIEEQNHSTPKHQIRKWFALYPELEEEITRGHPEYNPLICRYEVWEHREKILRTTVFAAGTLGTIGILVASPIAWIAWAPALPKVLLVSGALKVGERTLKLRNSIADWDRVKAATLAGKMLKFEEELRAYLSELQKTPTAEHLALIAALEKELPSLDDIEHLKNVKAGKRDSWVQISSGLLPTTFGVASVFGGLRTMRNYAEYKRNEQIKKIRRPASEFSGGEISIPASIDSEH